MGVEPGEQGGLIVFGAVGGTAQLLTTTYARSAFVAGRAIRCEPNNQATLYWRLSGTALTTLDWFVAVSYDGTLWFVEDTEAVAGAAVTHVPEGRTCAPTLPTVTVAGELVGQGIHVPLGSAEYFCVYARRTGGDGTSAALGWANFGERR